MADSSPSNFQELATSLSLTQLGNMQKRAESWLTTIASLTGLTSILVFFQRREQFWDISDESITSIGWSLLAAYILVAVAIYLAALASQGIPNPTALQAEALRAAYAEETKKSARFLNASRLATLGALAALGVVFYLNWFGQNAPETATGTLAYGLFDSGEWYCGSVIQDDGGQVSFTSTDETPTGTIIQYSFVDSCPTDSTEQ